MTIDIEAAAAALLRQGGFDLDDAPGAYAIATALLGANAIRRVHSRAIRGAHGQLDGDTIYVSLAIPPVRVAYAILHEVGHWHLRQVGYVGANVEAICDAIACALLVPRLAFCAALSEHGDSWERLAADFATSQTICALRYGEVVEGASVAVVEGSRVRVRGAPRPWPGTAAGWRALVGGGTRVAALTDSKRRLVFWTTEREESLATT